MAEFRTPQPIGTVLSSVAVVGTIGTMTSQPNIAVASLVGSVGSPMAIAGGTIGTVQSIANPAVASLVGSIGSPVVVAGGTVGTLQSLPNLAIASLVGSIGSPILVGGGTVGTVQALPNLAVASLVSLVGSVQSLANPAIASLVGSIGSPVVVGGGTIGTVQALPNFAIASLVGSIQSGAVSATITGGNIPDVGTVGTVLSAVAVQQGFPPTGVVATASGTIRGASGTLYGVLASTPYSQTSTVAATLLIYAFPGTVGNGTIPFQMILPPGQFSHWEFNRGLAYVGSLVASIIGTVNALFLT